MGLRLLALAVLLSLAGCDRVLPEPRTLRLAADAPVQKRDESIISARLAEHTRFLSPTYEMTAAAGELVVRGSAFPQSRELHYLLSHRGSLVARSATGRRWFSHDDVADAQAAFDEQQRTALNVRLSAQAAADVARLSSAGVGEVLVVEFDGQPLAAARVSGPIAGGALQLTIDRKPEEAVLIATILRSGQLSFAPGEVRLDPPR